MCTVDAIVKTDDGTNAGNVIAGIAPQFAPLLPAVVGDPTIIQDHVDCAVELISSSFFGSKYCKAVAYHAAHTLWLAYPALAQGTQSTTGGASGAAIQSLRAGDLSIAYSNAASSSQTGGVGSQSYGETPFGRMYLQLCQNCRRSPAIYFG